MPATPTVTLYRGENKRLVRLFTQADGTPLTIASMSALSVVLSQGAHQLAEYVLGDDDELTEATGYDDENAVVLELTPTFSTSSALKAGLITERWTFAVTDADFIGGSAVDVSVIQNVTFTP